MHSLEEHLEDTCIFDEYVTRNHFLQCTPTHSNAEIVASLQNVEEEEDDDGDDVGEEHPTVTYSQVFTIIINTFLHNN